MDRSLPQPPLRKEMKTTTKTKNKPEGKQHKLKHIVSFATRRISLMRIGCNAIDEQGNAVCIMRSFAYVCWLLRAISDKCEDESLHEGHTFSELTLANFLISNKFN